MPSLNKRVEIRIDEERLKILEEEARRRHKSVSNLVREAIDAKYQVRESRIAKKLKAVEELARINAPAPLWEQVEEEIRRGRLKK